MPFIELRAADGHTLQAFRSDPEQAPRGAIVIAQEVFGINAHMRAVVAVYAGLGYATIAPALFDRIERDVELGYDEAGLARGRELAAMTSPDTMLLDLRAALDAVATVGKVGTVGYCFGGSVAWLAAAELEGVVAAVSYYGSRIRGMRDRRPRVPVLMHVGRHDASFPLDEVHAIAAEHPGVTAYEYEAGHGFACDHRRDFQPDAAARALERTLAFFAMHLG